MESPDAFVSAVHPDRSKQFRASAAPKKVIKQGRREALLGCTTCGTPEDEEGVKLRECSECRVAKYCSRECQKENWPIHKKNCDPDLDGGIQPLIKSVTGNPMLAHYLQICLSFEFHLHKLQKTMTPENRKKVIRSPLFVHIDVGIEPTRITDFMKLYTFKEDWDKEDLEGMLQFHHLSSARSGVRPETILTPTNCAIWKQARDAADDDGLEDHAVVLVRFANNMKQTLSCTLVVEDEALESAEEAAPFTQSSSLTGKTTSHPMNIASCFEFMNTHIRSDTKNHLLLRRPMRKCDKELVRDANRREKDLHAANAFRIKINREYVYKSHAVEIVIPPGGSKEDAQYRVLGTLEREVVDKIQNEVAENSRSTREGRAAGEQAESGPSNRAERRRMEREKKKVQKNGKVKGYH